MANSRGFARGALTILLISVLSTAQNLSSAQETSSAHQELTSRGFPVGLLPDTVSSYSLGSDGKFVVRLDGGCHFTIPNQSYPVSYAPTITGVLKNASIQTLDGITVKAFYKWWTITGIRARDADLVFEVGLVNVNYPASNFDETPTCKEAKKKKLHSKA